MQTQEYLPGEFYLTGVPEMASGFKFSEDGDFQFFYSYGASDRTAEGHCKIIDNLLVLQGNKIPGKDFNLVQKTHLGNGITIQINHPDKMFVANVVCFLYADNEPVIVETGANGIAKFKQEKASKIELIHALFPDVPTVLDIKNEAADYFEFSLNLSLEQVVFDNVKLSIKNNSFFLKNIYLFGDEPVLFVKK